MIRMSDLMKNIFIFHAPTVACITVTVGQISQVVLPQSPKLCTTPL